MSATADTAVRTALAELNRLLLAEIRWVLAPENAAKDGVTAAQVKGNLTIVSDCPGGPGHDRVRQDA
jgi:hypothetical protein